MLPCSLNEDSAGHFDDIQHNQQCTQHVRGIAAGDFNFVGGEPPIGGLGFGVAGVRRVRLGRRLCWPSGRTRRGDSYHGDDYGSFINLDPKGLIGGAYAGYNQQFGNLVIGAEADINLSGIDRDRAAQYYDDGSSNDYHYGTGDVKWNGAIRARLGYAADRFLPYVAAGVAFAKYDVALMHDEGDAPFAHWERSASMTGWTLGGGIEYAATDNLMVRAEYRYSDYGNEKWNDPDWDGDLDVDLKTHDLRLGVAYKF